MMKSRIALFVCALVTPLAIAAAETNVAKLAAAYDAPSIGEAVQIESPVAVRISNLSLQLTSGSAAPVAVDGAQIGIFFSGKGSYVYRSTDSLETSLVMFEAKKLGRKAETSGDGSVTVTGEFERLYLRVGAIELPKLAGAPAPQLNSVFEQHLEHFRNVRWSPPSHLLIRQRLDNPASPVAVAELGGREENGYVLDTIERKAERFSALITRREFDRVVELRGAIFQLDIAEQPVGRRRADFLQPRFLLRNIDYTAVEGEKDSLKLSIAETVVARTEPQSVLRFNLQSGTFDTEGHYRKVRIDSVTDDAGKPLPFHFDRGSVLVGLPSKIDVKGEAIIRFEISGDILFHPNADSFWQLGGEAWFPRPSSNGQYYTIHSVVKVKKPWMAFAPGETIARREEGDFNVVENRVDKPVDLAVVHAGKYSMIEEKFEKATIQVATYAGKNEAAAKQLATLTYKIMEYYEPFLGPFPFKEFHIVEIHDLGWGQAPPATMFITKEAFSPLLGADNRAYSKGINQRIAHEVAHQYWGTVTKVGGAEEEWLSEAFAEYVSSQIEKELKGQGGYDVLLASWRSDAKQAGTFAPIPLANRIDTFDATSYISRVGLLYGKGAYLLAVIHKTVGDQKFLTFLRTLQGRFAWRFLTTKDVIETLSKLDGKDWQPFFDRYYYGREMPPMPR